MRALCLALAAESVKVQWTGHCLSLGMLMRSVRRPDEVICLNVFLSSCDRFTVIRTLDHLSLGFPSNPSRIAFVWNLVISRNSSLDGSSSWLKSSGRASITSPSFAAYR